MKIRQGFVSNSSSSSFILDTTSLTQDQIDKILDCNTVFSRQHYPIFDDNGNKIEDQNVLIRDVTSDYYWGDTWNIQLVGNKLKGYTIMNNDDLPKLMVKIGISPDTPMFFDDNYYFSTYETKFFTDPDYAVYRDTTRGSPQTAGQFMRAFLPGGQQ
jgi:hypothetical protein